ncbi:MAG: hypothetical protein KGI47_00225 [Betaproteobacteria bacterium]|nr:hypothetical protein [Betaproteobacteria bacterium]
MKAAAGPNNNRLTQAVVAVIMAAVLNHFGDRLLGVRIEVFTGGIGYFSGLWVMDVFLLPFVSGIVVAILFGKGAKWLCYLPPLIVRGVSYFEVASRGNLPPGHALLPLGWWGFFVILVMESAMIGAILGEVMIKRTYGRRPRHMVYKDSPSKNRGPEA